MPRQNSQRGRQVSRLISYLGLFALVIIGVLSAFSASEFRDSAAWRTHTDAVISDLRKLRSLLDSAESAQRGYIVSEQIEFLDTFDHDMEEVEVLLPKLHRLLRDNPEQKDRLESCEKLVGEKEVFLKKIIDLGQHGKFAEAKVVIKQGRGKSLMDEIASCLTELEGAEELLLKVRSEKADADFARTSYFVLIGLLFAFLLLLAAHLMIQREIKLRERTEVDLISANAKALEASNLKSSFLANMSHEIRTPLNGIIGMSKLLEQTELNDRQVDYVETIKMSSNSLLALINQILDLSKIESGKLQLEETNFELKSLLQSAVQIVDYSAKAKGLRIVVEMAQEVPEFFLGDPLRLRQVLLNLLNNAVKFSEKGIVKLRVSVAELDGSLISLKFEVIDQGVGIDPEIKSRLFQSFSQGDESTSRRFGGSGLGLAISKQIVELMGGTIDVESIKGVGSRFEFKIRMKIAKYDESARPMSVEKMVLKNLHGYVLIAEDNKVNQKVVIEMVQLLGCRVKVVENGEEAIQALQEDEFNLVLMDGQMPVVDGYAATRSIREGKAGERNKLIPILATTANAIKGDIERCLEAGMNDYISKPISYDDLAFKVEKWISRGQRVLDESSLARLAQLEKKSGKPIFRELVDLFEQEAPVSLEKMRAATQEGSLETVSFIAHGLKSSAANLGAFRLREISERLERMKNGGTDMQINLLLDSAEKEVAVVLNELKSRSEYLFNRS